MARFCKSQDGRLTLAFADKAELAFYAEAIQSELARLAKKYQEWGKDGPIVTIWDIKQLDGVSGTSQTLSQEAGLHEDNANRAD